MQCNKIRYNTVQYSTIQYNTIQYNIIQYNTILITYNRPTKNLLILTGFPVALICTTG